MAIIDTSQKRLIAGRHIPPSLSAKKDGFLLIVNIIKLII